MATYSCMWAKDPVALFKEEEVILRFVKVNKNTICYSICHILQHTSLPGISNLWV